MRLRPFIVVAAAGSMGLASVAVGGLARADFDPHGHHHKPPPVGPTGRPPVRPAGSGVASPSASASDAPDTGPKKDPIRKATIIALARPGDAGPVLKLAQLYRERDGSLDKGIADWKARADDATASVEERWSAEVTYAGLLRSDKRDREAAAAYQVAITQKPDRAVALLALARLDQDSGDLKGAYDLYEKALPLQKDKTEREYSQRTLMELAVDLKDVEKAHKWHAELVRANGDSMTVRGELGRLYTRKGFLELAETELLDVVKAAAGDNRALPGALLDLGLVQVKLQKYDAAIATLERGLSVAGAQAGARPRLLNAIAEAYRAQNRIEELVGKLEKEKPTDVDRQELLGKLAAEFDADKAIVWLEKALASAPSHADTRILLIRLLKEQSRIDEAIKQYDALIASARGQPQFVTELCDLLIGRGDRAKCLGKLKELEGSASDDAEVLERLASYYSQIGEDKLALALMERLAKQGGDDPSYVVDLGDYYYQRGDSPKAKEIWKRLLVLIKPKSKALAALGEVYLDHDLGEDALVAYREAGELAPGDVQMQKGLATALEHTHHALEAEQEWETILRRNDVDKTTRREARTHLVLMWQAQKKLPDQVKRLSEQLAGPPVDLEAGRLLAEVLSHLRRLPEAAKTLREVIDQAPGDVDARLVLEHVLVQQNDLGGAIKVLEALLKADPKGARAYYLRLAQYALVLYRDEDALKYAAAAVELSPDDAEGHKKLGEMYRSQQDFPRAIKELRLAIQHNPKLWAVYFELAELLLAQGDEVEGDALYRRVMRGAGDDDLVASAIRLSAAINQKRGTLEVLETELLPIALGNPQKPVYRRLLVEVYANLTAPLIQKLRLGGPDAEIAHDRLVKIGQRGVQPMIDALSDPDIAQQRIAIELLAFVENKSSGLPLFAYATGTGDATLRGRAMFACGALGDAALLPKLEAYLFPKGGYAPRDDVAVGAAYGIARILEAASRSKDRKTATAATTLADKIIETTEPIRPEMRVYAAIALGTTRDDKQTKVLSEMLKRTDVGAAGRAAAIWSLAELGDTESRATFATIAETSTDAVIRQAAILALARASLPRADGRTAHKFDASDATMRSTVRLLAEATLDGNPRLQHAGAIALAALATGVWRGVREPLLLPEATASSDLSVAVLVPHGYGPADFGAALTAYEPMISSAATAALQLSKERALVVLDDLLTRAEGPSFGVFTDVGAKASGDGKPPPSFAAAARIADAVEPFVVGLVHHPDLGVQTRAVRWLGRRDTKGARAGLVEAVGDLGITVQRLALEELAVRGDASTVAVIAKVLTTDKEWAMREAAARALGAIGARDAHADVAGSLEKAATSDGNAFVREAALIALIRGGGASARPTVERAAKEDVEPRVRARAVALLAGATGA